MASAQCPAESDLLSANSHRPAPTILVVGASHSAVRLVDTLRASGFQGRLHLIGEEPHNPYQRPALSKGFLKGDITAESLEFRDRQWYSDNDIELTLGQRVVRIDQLDDGSGAVHTISHDQHTDSAATTSHSYDRLVLATGARPRALTITGAEANGVLQLRGIDDARLLASRVELGPVVVIGGGFIGLEAAATIRDLGGSATVLEAGPRLMGRALGADTARFLLDAHRAMGVDVQLDTVPAAILTDADGHVRAVRTALAEIPARTVLVGIGVEPRIELAEALGLKCSAGIVVDHDCLASDGRTLAIGDCTVQPLPGLRLDPGTGVNEDRTIRLESVDNAVEQADCAARTLLESTRTHRSAPWFWSDQGPWKLQIVGIVGEHDSTAVRADPGRPTRLIVGYFKGPHLIAAECVNAPADFLALRSALTRRASISAAVFADHTIPLKKTLTSASAPDARSEQVT